jgi:hypothetical protein
MIAPQSHMPKVTSRIPTMSDDEMFRLFENVADRLHSPLAPQAEAVLAALGIEWGRRHTQPKAVQVGIGAPSVGLLKRFGYCVGTTHAVPAQKRRKILESVFILQQLPLWHSPSYVTEWGGPMSSRRFRKIHNCLSGFIANAELNDSERFARAIREWNEDLNWLHGPSGLASQIVGEPGFRKNSHCPVLVI